MIKKKSGVLEEESDSIIENSEDTHVILKEEQPVQVLREFRDRTTTGVSKKIFKQILTEERDEIILRSNREQ